MAAPAQGQVAGPARFDLATLDEYLLIDPFPTYARLREESPIHRNPDGIYFVVCYPEGREILRNKEMSSGKEAQMTARFGSNVPLAEHNLNVIVFVDLWNEARGW